MYQEYWGLSGKPFASGLDVRQLHVSASHEEALARLQFLVDYHWRLGLVLGGAGLGKSSLLAAFARQLQFQRGVVVQLPLSGQSGETFLADLGSRLGCSLKASAPQLWRGITDQIHARRYEQRPLVLLLDDADRAAPEVLRQIDRLLQVDLSADARLTIVLSAAPDRAAQIGSRLLEQAELRIDLEAWELSDTVQFVTSALARVGRQTSIFTGEALEQLHHLSGGCPRRIRQLAELSLLAAAGGERPHVGPEVLEGVFQELGTISQ